MLEIGVYEFLFLCVVCYAAGILIGMLAELVRREDELDQADQTERLKAEKNAVETMHHLDRISGRAL